MVIAVAAACSGPSTSPAPVGHRTGPPGRVRVVLYGVTDFTGDDTRMRLQPMACAIDGVLTTGLPCGEAMPQAIEAKIVGGGTIRAQRTAADFHDGDGRPEAVVRERWRNGYGAMFLGEDWGKPLHAFGCGSI